jgi:hypothetical protein
VRVTVLPLLILNLDTKWRKWSALSSGHFNTESCASGSQQIGGWVVPRVSLDVSEKSKSLPLDGIETLDCAAHTEYVTIGTLDCAAHSIVLIQNMLP